MKIGLSALCVNRRQKTGLQSLFTNFVREALRLYPDVSFVIFAGEGVDIAPEAERRVQTIRTLPSSERVFARLLSEYVLVGHAAVRAGCDVLLTNALVPFRAPLPVAMHMLALHHLVEANETGRVRKYYRSWATRRGLRQADLIITNTEFACAQILQVDETVGGRLLQSYEGIDHQVFHDRASDDERGFLRAKFGVTSYLLWCSNFYPYKKAEWLVRAWSQLPLDVRRLYPLVMVGGGNWGDSRERAVAIAREHGAAEQLHLLGWIDDPLVPIVFRNARLFAHPSAEETFGRSVLESMASGVPCIVHDIPVMREIAEGAARLIDFADASAATAALHELLLDEPVRQGLIAAGVLRAQAFSFERLTVERIEALRELLGRSPAELRQKYPPTYASSRVASSLD